MRAALLVIVALIGAGCVTVAPAATPTLPPTQPSATVAPATPTPTPTSEPTPLPEVTPTGEPIPTPTPEETPEPDITPDPNATPVPTPVEVLPFLTSEMTVLNLGASVLSVTVALVDTASTDEYVVGTFDVQPDQVTVQLVVPARLRLDFDMGGSDLASCTIDVADTEQLQFAAIETGVVIANNGGEPVDAAEMLVATSSRCHAGEAV